MAAVDRTGHIGKRLSKRRGAQPDGPRRSITCRHPKLRDFVRELLRSISVVAGSCGWRKDVPHNTLVLWIGALVLVAAALAVGPLAAAGVGAMLVAYLLFTASIRRSRSEMPWLESSKR